MMDGLISRDPQTDNANRLVGRFLQHFAALERAVDAGIGKLLSIEPHVMPVLAANVDFSRKVSILFSAENVMATMPDKERNAFLKDTRSKILALNDARKVAAHDWYEANESGAAVFRRTTANGKLAVQTLVWDQSYVEGMCERSRAAMKLVEKLVEEITPYQPSLDFSDPRNSMYLPLLLL